MEAATLDYNELVYLIFGTGNLAFVIAGGFFAVIGGLLSMAVRATKKKIEANPVSPATFSWSYLWCDKANYFYASVLITILMLRFSAIWIPPMFAMAGAAGIGFLNYQLIAVFLKWVTKFFPDLETPNQPQ